MTATMLHNIEPNELAKLIEEATRKITGPYNPERFSTVMVPVDWVCKIHSISRNTAYRWIKQGILVPETDSSEDIKFRLSEVLTLDLKAIKRKRNKNLILNQTHE